VVVLQRAEQQTMVEKPTFSKRIQDLFIITQALIKPIPFLPELLQLVLRNGVVEVEVVLQEVGHMDMPVEVVVIQPEQLL